MKNEIWKKSEADWVIVSDLDEWVDIRPSDLEAYEAEHVTIVKTEGISLVWPNDTYDLSQQVGGVSGNTVQTSMYSKPCLFDRRAITEYGSSPGGHMAHPKGRVKWLSDVVPSIPPPRLYHAKYFNEDYLVTRGQMSSERLSENNLNQGYGIQYLQSELHKIPGIVAEVREKQQPIHGIAGGLIFTPGEGGSPIRYRE